MEADTRGSSQPRPVIHGSAAERAELAGAATPLQSTAASTPVRAALLSDDSPGGGSPSLRRSLSTRPSFLPSLRRNFAPRRWNSFVQIKSAAWKYHARPPARHPTSQNMTKVADGLLALPLEGRNRRSEGGAKKYAAYVRYPGNLKAAHLPQIGGNNNAATQGSQKNHACIVIVK